MEGKKITPPKSPSKIFIKSPEKNPVKTFSVQSNVKPMTNYSKTVAQKPSAVSSGERVQPAITRPINKKKLGIIFIVVLLTVMVVASTVLILVYPRESRLSDISVNFTTEFSLAPISVDHGDMTNYKVMPGDEFDCNFTIQSDVAEDSGSGNLDVFLRVKASFVGNDNYFSGVEFNFVDDDCWFKGADGYYYYTKSNGGKGVVSPGDRIVVSKRLAVDIKTGNEYAGKSVNILFSAEALQANYQAIKEIWITAPYEWANQYKDLLWQ